MLLYLPPYSPDLNPIEASFSACMLKPFLDGIISQRAQFIGKAHLRRNGAVLRNDNNDPILVLLDSIGCITGEMAEGWFRHAGYIVE